MESEGSQCSLTLELLNLTTLDHYSIIHSPPAGRTPSQYSFMAHNTVDPYRYCTDVHTLDTYCTVTVA